MGKIAIRLTPAARRKKVKGVIAAAFDVMNNHGDLHPNLVPKVKDCILDYVPLAIDSGIECWPVTFGLTRSKDGLALVACSEVIRNINEDGLRLNDDGYNAVDALLIAAEMNRIFEVVQKRL